MIKSLEIKHRIKTYNTYLSDNFIITVTLKPGDSSIFSPNTAYLLGQNRFIMIRSGSCVYEVDLVRYNLCSNDFIFIPQGCIISLVEYSEDLSISVLSSPFIEQTEGVKGNNNEFLNSLFETMWIYVSRETIETEILKYLCQSLSIEIGRLGERQSKEVRTTRKLQIFDEFMSLLRNNDSYERKVEPYASRMRISSHYLSMIVKDLTGQSPVEWINKAIIRRAQILLSSTDLSVEEVSYSLNFPNPAFFNRFFKKGTGYSPGRYRKTILCNGTYSK
ncbi:MAG: AraC family transcriptional regulator [Bacteroides sp.]|nr:AraC family transcriptional regulator [Bacteroides sp.]